ncbi:MAG: hypothetical protein QW524_02155 [Candidatus Woesearchaeota archaeon]
MQDKKLIKKRDKKKISEEREEKSYAYEFISKHSKILIAITLSLFLLAIVILSYAQITEGSIIRKGITLRGGSEIFISEKINLEALLSEMKTTFKEVRSSEVSQFGRFIGYAIETSERDSDKIKKFLINFGIPEEKITIRTTSPELSESFFREIFRLLLIAYVVMFLIIFLRFRNIFVGFTLLLANISNIVLTLSVLYLIDFRLSLAGVAALLMLIGYSIDTNILLVTRMIKEKGDEGERFNSALKTGLMMSITTLISVLIAFFLTNSSVIKEIMFILFIGLLFDMMNTWIQNASLIILYLKKERAKKLKV